MTPAVSGASGDLNRTGGEPGVSWAGRHAPILSAQRVRIYLSEGDSTHHQATFIRIVELLRREGAAGAGVFRGIAGFGASGQLHSAAFPDVVQPLPLIVEWIDTPDRVARLLPGVCAEAPEALITIDDVRVVQAGQRVLRDVSSAVHVRDVMTRAADVDCVAPETSLHEVAVRLLRERLRAVPVVDAGRRVVGIITNGDLVERGGLPLRLELLGALGDPERPAVASHLTGLRGEGRNAASIMTPGVVTIHPDALVTQAAKLMLDRRLKRLPVVDAGGHLLGMLSRLDVLKTATTGYPVSDAPVAANEVSNAGAPDAAGTMFVTAGPRNGRRGSMRRVGQVMNRHVPTVRPTTPLPDVLDAVVSTRLNRAVVVDDERRPVGIVVDADLLQRVTPAAHPGVIQALMRRVLPGATEQREAWQRLTGHTARDLMRPRSEMLVVSEDADIAAVIDRSLAQRIKLAVVTDGEGRLIGMADRADLLAALVPAG